MRVQKGILPRMIRPSAHCDIQTVVSMWMSKESLRRPQSHEHWSATMNDVERFARLERHVRQLRAVILVSAGGLAVLSLSGFWLRPAQHERFSEIDVERINIVEPNGRIRMAISDLQRSPAPMYKGKPFAYAGGTRAGAIFYDDEGTESGGLTFRGKLVNGKPSAAGHLSFDQYGQDQVINLEYQEGDGHRQQGLTIDEHADVPLIDVLSRYRSIQAMPAGAAKADSLRQWTASQDGVAWGAHRLFLGRDQKKTAVLDLRDTHGRSRLRLSVDSIGGARIEFLNDSGRVVRTFTGTDR
jgi:hypothetical protein